MAVAPGADFDAHQVPDSFRQEVFRQAPIGEHQTALQRVQALAATAVNISVTRAQKMRDAAWMTMPLNDEWLERGNAWGRVVMSEADYLPPHSTHPQFKVNHFCETCAEDTSKLCQEHAKLKDAGNVNLTYKHFAAVRASGHCLVECGGNGDCFYHSMLFIAKLFRPDLFEQWQTHAKFRVLVCEELTNRQPCLGTMDFVAFLRSKKSRGKQNDEAVLRSFIQYHKKCFRKEKGIQVNGAFVENEIIAAVAQQFGLFINVAHYSSGEIHVVTPDGSETLYSTDAAHSSPFFLWCTGAHYQAIVSLQHVEVRESALNSHRFRVSDSVDAKDVRLVARR